MVSSKQVAACAQWPCARDQRFVRTRRMGSALLLGSGADDFLGTQGILGHAVRYVHALIVHAGDAVAEALQISKSPSTVVACDPSEL